MSDETEALRRPIFLVGSERSGTTLLRLMLDHHPELAFNPEFEYAVSQIGEDGTPPDVAAYAAWLRTDFIFPGAGFSVDTSLNYQELVRDFLRQKLERDGKKLVGATVHHHFDRLLDIWPEARFIHLLRDPRDVSRSVIGMGWAGNVWVGMNRWMEAELLWEKLRPRLPENRYVEVRYEDLIQNCRLELTRLCEFIGVEYDEAMLTYADQSTYDLPDPKLVYQWRKKLSPDEISLVEHKAGELLTQRGYEPSGQPAITVDPQRAAQLEAESRAWCRKFRVQRYGLPLLLMAKVTRHLPFRRLSDFFQLKMNEIDLKFIK